MKEQSKNKMIDIIWEKVYNIARNLETLIQKKGG